MLANEIDLWPMKVEATLVLEGRARADEELTEFELLPARFAEYCRNYGGPGNSGGPWGSAGFDLFPLYQSELADLSFQLGRHEQVVALLDGKLDQNPFGRGHFVLFSGLPISRTQSDTSSYRSRNWVPG